MPTVEDHKEIALAALRMFAQPDSTPELDDVELNSILDSVQRASFWTTATAYVVGDVVLPITPNGHRFRCIEGGTTGAAEPEWPKRNAATITDGTARWEEAGPDYENVFDIRDAAQQAWLTKQAKASVLFDTPGQRTSQIAEHCKQMADSFDPIKIA